MKRRFSFLFGAFVFLAAPVQAVEGVRTVNVRFARGASSQSFDGAIKGHESVHYYIRARAGQFMTVRLETDLPSNFFQVYQLGPKGPMKYKLLHDSNSDENNYRGQLSVSGEYLINVLIFREDARQQRSAHYRLKIGVVD